jgi:hypothetical protein
LIDTQGNLVNASSDVTYPARNLADRSYFRFILAHPEAGTFISETLSSRQTDTPKFYLARRVTGPGGSFAGVLIGAVQVP